MKCCFLLIRYRACKEYDFYCHANKEQVIMLEIVERWRKLRKLFIAMQQATYTIQFRRIIKKQKAVPLLSAPFSIFWNRICNIPFTLHLFLGTSCVYRGSRGWWVLFHPSSPFIKKRFEAQSKHYRRPERVIIDDQ